MKKSVPWAAPAALEEWMDTPDDHTLLRQYTEHHSEAAFTTLVGRHLQQVYAAAYRQTGDPHQAEEITQVVFVLLARKAQHLGPRVVLSGWLVKTARLTAITHSRSHARRTRREQDALMHSESTSDQSGFWPQLEPLLDAAIADLGERDRSAIVLRYFEDRSLQQVATALGVSEDAAKMRVLRAVEKLRRFFGKRGLILTAGALTSTIASRPLQAAPAGLELRIVATVLTKAPLPPPSNTLLHDTLAVMTWRQVRIPALILAGLMILGGGALLQHLVTHPDTLMEWHRRLLQ